MAENRPIQHQAPDLSNPEQRHEHADVNVWAVGKVGIVLVLVTIASLALMFGLFRYFEMRENASQAPPPAVVRIDEGKQPPSRASCKTSRKTSKGCAPRKTARSPRMAGWMKRTAW